MPEGKKSLNPIPSTLRGKKRYVKFTFISAVQVSERDAWNSISSAFSRLFGASGMAGQRLWLVKWYPQSNEGILRCALAEEEMVKAGLLFVQNAGSGPVIPLILKVSGSVKKLKT